MVNRIKFCRHLIFIAIIVLLSVGTWFISSQSLAMVQSKVDPVLRMNFSLSYSALKKAKDYISLKFKEGKPFYHVIVRANSDESKIEATGAKIRSRVGDIFTITATDKQIDKLSELPGVIYISPSRKVKPCLDKSVEAIRLYNVRAGNPPWTGFTGKGVIVSAIDTGIDPYHEDFMDPEEGGSRILYIWDQTNDFSVPFDFTYGTEWTKESIDNGICTERDEDGHGTHVMGIAAGNGSATGNGYQAYRYVGVAPEADIVFVKTNFYQDEIIDALTYIDHRAETLGEPYVVNASFGTHLSPHDGTSNFERAFSQLAGPGKIIVAAAGNEGNFQNIYPWNPAYADLNHIHAEGIATGLRDIIQFRIPDYIADTQNANNDFVEMVMWYQGGDSIKVKVRSPSGFEVEAQRGYVTPNGGIDTDDGTIYIDNASAGVNPNNGDCEVYIKIWDKHIDIPPASGRWTLYVEGENILEGGAYDIWIDLSVRGASIDNTVFESGWTNSKLVCSPATGYNVLAVGSFVTKNEWRDTLGNITNLYSYTQDLGDISWFSSPGPSRDGRLKPDICAPGSNIASAASYDAIPTIGVGYLVEDGQHVIMHGTSMAAPHVAGVAALILELQPKATFDTVRDLITSTAYSDAYTGAVPNNTWGYGKLDAGAAVSYRVKTPPNNLHVVETTQSTILLSWVDNSINEAGFEIQRKEGETGAYTVAGTVGPNFEMFRDTDLKSETTYYYRVRAYFNEGGVTTYSGFTAEVHGTTTAGGTGHGGGGCFIATAACGSPFHHDVMILKNFRDNILEKDSFGKKLVSLYYKISPPIADFIAKRPWLKTGVRITLAPFVLGSYIALKTDKTSLPLMMIGFMLLLFAISMIIIKRR